LKFTNDLGSDNIKGLVWTLAVPSMLSQLVSVLYSIVDRMYIGNIPSNGTQALAGVGVCGPIVTLISSFAFLVGIGGAPLVSINLGEKNIAAAKKVIANCFVYILALAVPVTVLAYIFRRPILLTFGATEAVYPYAETYFSLYLIGTVFALTATGMNQFIITQGHSRSGMLSVLIGAIINIVLDPIFIFALHMGVAGAAIATGLSQCVGGLFPLLYFLRPNTSKLRLVRTKLELRPILNACGNGSSELMSNISSSIVSMVYNFQLLKYLGEDGVSAYGVLMYVQFVFVAIYIGYSIGCAPIVGFHYGAQNHPELKNMLRMSVILMSASGVVLTVLARVLAAPLAKIFVGYDEGLFTLTCHAFRLFSFAFLFAGFNIFASSFFTALGNGLISAAISFLRTLVFQTSSVILLPLLLGVDGIWYAITAAEIFATLISIIFLLAKRRKYHYM